LGYPGVQLLGLTLPIVVESTRLPGNFHRYPADQLFVATARLHGAPMATADRKILAYQGVETFDISA
jgi:PIN domain nuclease of toxin-antitoxin system